MTERLREFYEQVEPSTVDVMVFAGAVHAVPEADHKENLQDAANFVEEVIGVKPAILEAPVREGVFLHGEWEEFTDVFFDTKRRRLHVKKH